MNIDFLSIVLFDRDNMFSEFIYVDLRILNITLGEGREFLTFGFQIAKEQSFITILNLTHWFYEKNE